MTAVMATIMSVMAMAVATVIEIMVAVVVMAIRSIIRTISIIWIAAAVVTIVTMMVIESPKYYRSGKPGPNTPTQPWASARLEVGRNCQDKRSRQSDRRYNSFFHGFLQQRRRR